MSGAGLAADLLAVLGTLVSTVGVLGVALCRDRNVKIHASALVWMLGLPLVLAAAVLAGDLEIRLRTLLVLVAAVLTSPLATLALAERTRARRRPPPSSDD